MNNAQSKLAAELRFLSRVAELGAALAIGATYEGWNTPVDLICSEGHHCRPRPCNVRAGHAVCLTCSGFNPVMSANSFWVRVMEQGAVPASDAVYRNNRTPVSLICVEGHSCNPRPSDIKNGQRVCFTCSGQNPKIAEVAFLMHITERGAVLAPGAAYVNSHERVSLICWAGHKSNPLPSNIQKGQGICQQCAVTYDRAYLLQHTLGAIKIGVASGDARVRRHLHGGYRLVKQWQGLEHKRALLTEQQCIRFWRSQGWPQSDAAPKDGRTETTSSEHLPETLAWLNSLMTTHPRNPTH